jgi:hypothetical protein
MEGAANVPLAPHNRWPSAADEPLNGLVDVELVNEALEDGLAGDRQMSQTRRVPDTLAADLGVGMARKDAALGHLLDGVLGNKDT